MTRRRDRLSGPWKLLPRDVSPPADGHTPGPWKTVHPWDEVWAARPDGEDVHICHPAVSEANARLISAAPDLLEACKAVVGAGYCENRSPFASQDYVTKSTIAKVRAAIAKAAQPR